MRQALIALLLQESPQAQSAIREAKIAPFPKRRQCRGHSSPIPLRPFATAVSSARRGAETEKEQGREVPRTPKNRDVRNLSPRRREISESARGFCALPRRCPPGRTRERTR